MTRVVGGARIGVRDVVLGRPLWLAAIAASGGAGLIHLAYGPAHLRELGALGAGFYLAAALQLGWAALTLAALARSRTDATPRGMAALAASGIGINGAILAAWVTSRVVGLPAGEAPWTPEPIGMADGMTAILQGALVVGLMAFLRGWALPGLPRVQQLVTAGAASAMLLIATGTAVATSPSEVGHAHPSGYEHGATDGNAAPWQHADTDEHAATDGHAEDAVPLATDEHAELDNHAEDGRHDEDGAHELTEVHGDDEGH